MHNVGKLLITASMWGLRLYTRYVPFARGRGIFIHPVEWLKSRGYPAPLMKVSNGLVMEFEPSLIGWTCFERGSWEEEQTNVVLNLVQAGMVVVNVGANTGYYTLVMAGGVGPNGRVFAFEIQPEMTAILRRNIRHNNFADRVTIIEKGCYSSAGRADVLNLGDPGSAQVATREGGEEGAGAVELVTLDTFLSGVDIRRLDFVLIDTEGADFEVIKGAKNLLSRFKPVVLVESDHLRAFGSSEEDLIEFMTELGYAFKVMNNEFSRDVLFTLESQGVASR
jgi:FkbM family methyltransferase